MAVTASYTPARSTGNGVTVAYPANWPVFAATDILVTLFDTSLNSLVSPQPVLNGGGTYDYTVTFGTQDTVTLEYATVTATFNNAPLGNHRIILERQVAATQPNIFSESTRFPAASVGQMGDRAIMALQQDEYALTLAIRAPTTDPSGLTYTVPVASQRANTLVGFDVNGSVVVTSVAAAAVLSLAGQAASMIRVNSGATDFEFRTAGQVIADLFGGSTGTGDVVRATTPTLITPVLGVATATSINKVTLTAPASAATLTIANNKTLTVSNSLTLAGTDSTTLTFQGTDTYVGRATTDALTNKTYDTAGSGNVFKINGATISDKTGTGKAVLDTAPTVTGLSSDSLTVTGSSPPVNGIFLPTTNTLGFATNSTAVGAFDASGRLLVKTTASVAMVGGADAQFQAYTTNGALQALFGRFQATASGTQLGLVKSRNATIGSHTIVQSGDQIGRVLYYGDDGTNHQIGAEMTATVDASPGTGSMPTRLALQTTSTGNTTTTEAQRIDSSQQIFFPVVTTTASAANAYLDNATTPANQLKRSTSSIRYKHNVRDMDLAEARRIVGGLRPVWFNSRAPSDDPARLHIGLIAEELAPLQPALVHFSGGRPDAVQYERVTVPMALVVSDHDRQLTTLAARIAALEQRTAA